MTTSSVSGNNAATSSAGITTPTIDVAGIVSSLMAVEQRPITTLNKQISSYNAKISAIGSVQSALASFQTAAQGLNNLTFNSFAATSSNTAAVSATASSIAKPGNYSLTIGQLAQAQNLVVAGQASATTAIGSGAATTLTFDFGTISGGTLTNGTYTGASYTSNGGTTKSVTIDSSNNTLSGIRDAINSANVGVTASIINDGSTSPYRLVLTSNTTGVANSMKISVAGDATLSGLFSENPAGTQNLSQTSAAQNANFTVNGIAVSKASNSVGDVVSGVTLNLASTSTSPVALSVAPNTSAVSTAINGFVTAFNAAVTAIQNQTSYDPTTKTAGTLQGDVSLSIVQSQMAAMLTTTMGSNPNGFTNLTQIGIGFQKDGTLAVDSTKLNAALNSNYQSVANLFVAAGSATDSLVNYTSASSSTKAGTYGVNISQLSTQGTAIGSTAAGLTITSGSNDTLSLTIDGTSTSVTIPAGTYTAAALATQLQTLINGSAPISGAGKSVTVSQNAGVLTLISSSYGSSSSVAVGGNGASSLFGTPTQTTGLDVAGTINGLAATGSGQLLTSSSGDSTGLSVAIQGGTTGNRGSISYTQGLSSLFNSQIAAMLGTNGTLASETTQFNSNISDAQKQIDALNAQIAVDQTNLTNQYAQLDAMLGSMNSLSSYLTQQLARL
ncbi:flagellar filament capping protein FliD [Sideroxydans sp. CL21]|uniref:flagellar filament capping protein FliD n=1 Tax=Sideroxydans sp. CL21 TaxID=2600596 RepID=UPI0024BC3751|nr:flagellar filament capping protein FliD [Sideroxydans sp. CL21]